MPILKSFFRNYIILFLLLLMVAISKNTNAQCANFVKVAPSEWHCLGLKSDGSLWSWGTNVAGARGDTLYSIIYSFIPTQIGTDFDWADIAAGEYFSIALKKDGTMWGWGYSAYLPLSTSGTITLPTKCTSDSNWKSIAAGHRFALGLKKDGTIWAWGSNAYGQLGDGTFLDKTTPAQIGSDTNWVTIGTGYYHSFGIKKDSSLWGWGRNSFFQLGDSTNTTRATPTKIDSTKKWKDAKGGFIHSIGIQANGSIWTWGENSYGQLGLGILTVSPTYKSTPQRVGSDTDWKQIDAGFYHSLALKKDEKLWGWGYNDMGQLGIGKYSRESSPVAIDSAKNWSYIKAGFYQSFGIQNDKSLWSTGNNNSVLGFKAVGSHTTIFGKVNGKPKITGNLSTCQGNTEILFCTDSPATVNPWRSTDTTVAKISDLGVLTCLTSGTTTIIFKNSEACEDSVLFTVKPLPSFIGRLVACIGDSSLLTSVDSAADYAWYSSNTSVAIISNKGMVKAMSSGISVITFIGKNGCVISDTFTVLKETSKPIVASLLEYCQFSTASNLSATGTLLKWYLSDTGKAFSTIAPTPLTSLAGTTVYYVSATDPINSCESIRVAITVKVNPQPSAPVVVSPIHYCEDAVASSLTAVGVTLKWYDNDTGGVGSILAPMPDTKTIGRRQYFVSQSNIFACESKRSKIEVNILPKPEVPIVITPLNICLGAATDTLVAIGEKLKWYASSSDTDFLSKSPKPSSGIVGAFSFYVSQTDSNACESERSVLNININPVPDLALNPTNPSSIIICRYNSLLIKALSSSIVSYEWQFDNKMIPSASSDSLRVTQSGNYSVTVTNGFNCSTQQPFAIHYDDSPQGKLSPAPAQICEGNVQLLSVAPSQPDWRYEWYFNQKKIDTIDNYQAQFKDTGTYHVIYTNQFGCTYNTNEVHLSYFVKTKPIINLFTNVAHIPHSYLFYQWYKDGERLIDELSYKVPLNTSGLFHVEVIDSNGCANQSDTIDYQTNPIYIDQIKIYPNPTHNVVTIESQKSVDVKVFDIIGQLLIYQKDASTINLSAFADGIYLFFVVDKNDKVIATAKVHKMN